MAKRQRSADPEIWCDFNGRIMERGFLPASGTAITDEGADRVLLRSELGGK
jgi:hypothetical protein